LGSTSETFYFFVPNFEIRDGQGNAKYNLHPPTCCAGVCIDPCASCVCSKPKTWCKVPINIYPLDADGKEGDRETGTIEKVWAGFTSELLTDADNFEVKFPQDANTDMKANILGAVFLMNQLFFESSQQQEQGGAGF